MTQIAPGDPAHAVIDLFAHLTETILFRTNLIPERQRRVVLNLLQIPVRNARPAKGLVCLDAGQRSVNLPGLVRDGAQLRAGRQHFTALGELQPTVLGLAVAIKQTMSEADLLAMGITLQDLKEQYGIKRKDQPQPFQPKSFILGSEPLSLENSIDKRFYLALTIPKQLINSIDLVRENLAGITLNIGIAPADAMQAEAIGALSPRKLVWEFLTQDEDGNLLNLPLELVADSSRGGRQAGVVRLRLPENTALYDSLPVDDPMFAGVGDQPPELPPPLTSERVAAWLRLSCAEEPDLQLGYLAVNAIDIVGLGLKQDLLVGIGNGNPDQAISLPDALIDADSLVLQVEEDSAWVTWRRVDFLLGQSGSEPVYRLDAVSGIVYFGDGLEGGKRPPSGKRIRVASYLYGGGAAGNLPAGEIKELVDGGARLTVRHEWPCKGGVDAETVAQAERRIPQFLTHRNRAVTKADFKALVENNPVNPVAKAEVMEGFLPGATIKAARTGVPGVVSIFVLQPRMPAMRQNPKPSKALLKDVFEYLIQRVLVGTELYVLSPEYVPIAVGVNVDVLDPETEQETLQAVENALMRYLWPLPPGGALGEGWKMGVNVGANELEAQVARVAGVRAVKSLDIFQKRNGRWRRLRNNQFVTLRDYQLPELLGVSTGTGNGAPGFPDGIEAGLDGSGGRSVPAPVIPDIC
ncbi:MAG: putative baseplate assembly protein [Chromatiales bacterium]